MTRYISPPFPFQNPQWVLLGLGIILMIVGLIVGLVVGRVMAKPKAPPPPEEKGYPKAPKYLEEAETEPEEKPFTPKEEEEDIEEPGPAPSNP